METRSVVLFIGETGSGKSTLINCLASYFLGGSPSAPKIVIPNKIYRRPNVTGYTSAEANLDDPTCSQTSQCITYAFKKERRVYEFIDTSGLSDTRSVEHDDHNIEEILRAASQAKSLRAIVLIINGTTVRITLNVKNALERMAGNLPDVLLNNLIVIFTNCDKAGKNFDESSLPSPPAMAVAMNNSAFSKTPADWDDDDRKVVNFNWTRSMRRIDEVLRFIDELAPQSTQAFTQMLEKRERIRLKIDEAVQQVIKQQRIHQLLKELNLEEKKLEDKIKRNELDLRNVAAALLCIQTHLTQLQSRRESQEQSIAQYDQSEQQLNSNSQQQTFSYYQTMTQLANSRNPFQTQMVQSMVDNFSRQHVHYQEDLQDIRTKVATERQQHQLTQQEEQKASYEMRQIESRQRHISQALIQAKQTMRELQKRMKTLNNEIKETKRRIQSEMADVQQVCKELKTVCSRFNFVQELHSKKVRLQVYKVTLRDAQEIQDTDALLHQLDRLAVELMSN